MNLEQARSRSFEDILYMGIMELDKKPLPVELYKTDEFFFKKVFDLYNDIEENKVLSLSQLSSQTGLTSALCFIIAYYSLHFKSITIVSKQGNYKDVFLSVYDMFTSFIKMNYTKIGKGSSGEIKLKSDNVEYCTINFPSDLNFNISDLKEIVVFDTSNKVMNVEKYKDIMKNISSHSRFIMNFPDNKNLSNMIVENKIKTKEIKIF